MIYRRRNRKRNANKRVNEMSAESNIELQGPVMNDEEFLDSLKISGSSRRMAIALRRAVAELCNVSPGSISPDTTTQSIWNLLLQVNKTWDDVLLVFKLEDILSMPFPVDVKIPP